MDWFQHERYEQGHYAFADDNDQYVPDWARVLGWEGVGCWVVVSHENLKRAIPGLQIFSLNQNQAATSLGEPAASNTEREEFFTSLENRGVNLIGLSSAQELVCHGCTLRRTLDGDFHFVGMMEIRSPVTDPVTGQIKFISSQLPSRLTIVQTMGDVALPLGQTTLPGFIVPCQVTMKASELNQMPIPVEVPRVRSRSQVFLRNRPSSSQLSSQAHLIATRPPTSSSFLPSLFATGKLHKPFSRRTTPTPPQ